jgi:transcriptional regulator with XRE-family HTH domain
MTPARIAAAVRTLREERNWTQTELGHKLNMTNGAISKVERGLFIPKLPFLDKLGRAFGMQSWELLRFAERLHETIDSRHQDEPQLRSPNWRAA